jgi:RNA polymerase sporulation-specific sigma factor
VAKGLYLEHYRHDKVANSQYNRELFSKLEKANGDEKEDIIQEILLSNLRSVHYMLCKFNNLKQKCGVFRITYDELFSAGYYGLYKAIRTFNPNKGIQFMTYSSRIIQNEMLMMMRRFKKLEFDTSLSKLIGTEGNASDSQHELGEILPDLNSEEGFEWIVKKDLADRILAELEHSVKHRDFTIYTIYMEDEVTHRELAQLFGISQSYISRIINRCEDKCKKIATRLMGGSLL